MKSITLQPGRYILAVSGGLDSMVLLDMLRRLPGVELYVAHFDHGIRTNSQQDRKFVQTVAKSHNLSFVYETDTLGDRASEALARSARYKFLRKVCKKYNAQALVTAHHQDDLLETAIVNMLRGTGRRGLGSLKSTSELIRPLLGTPKTEILAYAQAHHIEWREDSTNNDQTYLRNYVRHSIMPKFSKTAQEKLLQIIVRQNFLNETIDAELQKWCQLHVKLVAIQSTLPRYQLIMLPPQVAYEILQFVLKQHTGNTVEKAQADRALLFAKTAGVGKRFELNNTWQLKIGRSEVIVEDRRP